MDVTSLKTPAMRTMDDSTGDGVSVIGTHPLFGPKFESFAGQSCVVIPSDRHPPGFWLDWWHDAMRAEDGIVVESTAAEHDRMMLLVQVLLHYTIMCFGSALAGAGADFLRVQLFKSPLYEVMMGLAARVFGTAQPHLYYAIQQHPEALAIRTAFIDCAHQVSEALAGPTDDRYRKLNDRTREALGESNVLASSSLIESIFHTLAQQRKALIEMKGQLVCVRNSESQRTHYGVIEDVTAESVVIRKRKEVVSISLKKAHLLSQEATRLWESANLRRQQMTLAVVGPEQLQAEFVAALLASRVGISTVAVLDEFVGAGIPSGYKKVSFRIEAPQSSSGDAALEAIRPFLCGIGCT